MEFNGKKSLGQHFLTDKNIIEKIMDSLQADPSDRVIEIGPGLGALTEYLYERFDDLHVIEIDERAVKQLREQYPGMEIYQEDVMDIDWANITSEENPNYVIGNLPYYITSQILFDLLSERERLTQALLMMQKEVAERLTASPGTKDYGILSVQTQLLSNPELLFNVSRNSFTPPPTVTSTVLRLIFDRPSLGCREENLKKVVRTAFNQRRKMLRNSLEPVLGDFKPADFDFTRRAEKVNPSEYEMLTEQLEYNGILT